MRKTIMNINIVGTLLALTLIQACSTEPKIDRVALKPSIIEGPMLQGISRDEAVRIASADALKDYKSLDVLKVVVCEQSIFWRVIYDGGGSEYVIDKASGRIIKKQKLPQGSPDASKSGSGTKPIRSAYKMAPTTPLNTTLPVS